MKKSKIEFAFAIFALLPTVWEGNGMMGRLLAQDTRFTQAFSNPLKLNPSIIGGNDEMKFTLDNRSQWGNIGKGFKSLNATAIYPLYFKSEKEKLNFGLNFLSDRAGAFKTMDVSIACGYGLKIADNNYLNFALQGGYIQRSLAASTLSFDEQYVTGAYSSTNPNGESTLNEKRGYPDVGYGLMWYYNPSKINEGKINAFIGLSGYHLNTPNESLVENKNGNLPVKFSYQGGIKILGKGKIDFTPNVRMTTQKGNEEIATGLCMDYSFSENIKMILGAWYRNHDAFALALGLDAKNFSVAYSYDMVTDLNRYISASNAHEVSLSFKMKRKNKEVTPQFEKDGKKQKGNDGASDPFPFF